MKYEIVLLEDLNILEMEIVKSREKWYGNDDHSRWVFKKDGLYYKIWNETYVRRDNVGLGVNCGFYDETTTPALHGLIYQDEICRGYITKECKNNTDDIRLFYEIIKKKTKEIKDWAFS